MDPSPAPDAGGQGGAADREPPGGPPVDVVIDADGDAAAREAIARGADHRTAVWVGAGDDPALEDFRTEIGRAR